MPQQYLIPRRVLKRFPGLQSIVWRLEALIFSGAIRFLAVLPPHVANRVAADLFYLFGPSTAKAEKVRRNLRIAFPELPARELRQRVRQTFAHLGKAMAELAQAQKLWRERERRLEVHVEDPSIEPIIKGAPVIFVTAHVGAWQYTTLIGPHYNVALTSLYAPESNPHMRELFFKLRHGLGGTWLSRDHSTRKLMRELGSGHSIGLVTDIRVDEGEPLPLFGHEAPTNTVPARLALRYQCPLITVRAERLSGARYRIVLSRLIKPDPGLDNADAKAAQMSREMNLEFERWIEASPGEWACMKRRWPKEIDRAAIAG